MHAIFLLNGLDLGGAERQAILLAQALRQHGGWSAEVLAFGAPGAGATLCERYGLPWSIVQQPLLEPVQRAPIGLARLGLELRRRGPTIVMPYLMLSNVCAGLSWRLSGASACVWNQRDAGLALMDPRLTRCAVRWTSRFIANSEHGARFLTETLCAPKNRVSVVHNGVGLPAPELDRAAWRNALGVGEREIVVTMVGNITSLKDHGTLLRAWAQVVARAGLNEARPVLVLAGSHGDAYARLRLLEAELALGGSVLWPGPVADVAGLLAASDIGVLSSRSEGLPNGVLEPMLAGLPVVATDIPGVRDAVGPKGLPWLAAPGDCDRLAELIITLICSRALRQAVGNVNRCRAQTEFSVARMVSRTVSIIGSLTETGGS